MRDKIGEEVVMKVLLTATVQSHICQFHKPLVEVLHSHGYEVHVAARNNLAEKNGLKLDFVDKVYDVPFARSPKSKDNLRAYKELKKIIEKEHYEIIHCNTPMGGVVTRLAATKARKNETKVYYTAHGFHFYKGAPKKNWLMYYPVEKIFAKYYTDKLITIANSDKEMALNHNFGTQVFRIHSVGINNDKYFVRTDEQIQAKREEEGYLQDEFICICTGELNENKNQKRLIEMLPKILVHIPNFKLLLAGNGPERENLINLAKELNVEKYIRFLGYRIDLENYVAIADVAISVSIREGLGINLIEAMACGKPVIGSDNRGHREFIRNGENGFIVKSDTEIVKYITTLFQNKKLRLKLGKAAEETAKLYSAHCVMKELEKIYFSE